MVPVDGPCFTAIEHHAENDCSIGSYFCQQPEATTGGRTEQLDIIAGFLPHHWLYE